MNNGTFGGRVAKLRAHAPGLSGRELDGLAGLHHGHVWQIERGARENATRDTARGLARVFGCSVGWLLEGEGDEPCAETVLAAVKAARVGRGASRTEGADKPSARPSEPPKRPSGTFAQVSADALPSAAAIYEKAAG